MQTSVRPPLRCTFAFSVLIPFLIVSQYSTQGKIKEPNLVAEAGQKVLSAVTSYAQGDMNGVMRSAVGLVQTATGHSRKAERITQATRTSPADVVRKQIERLKLVQLFFSPRFLGVVARIPKQVLIPRKAARPLAR